MRKLKNIVIDCDDVTVTKYMNKYKRVSLTTDGNNNAIVDLVTKTVSDNIDNKSYELQVLPEDFYSNGGMDSDVTSIDNPYDIMLSDNMFMLSKLYYDFGDEKAPELTIDTAANKANDFLKKLFTTLSFDCDIAAPTTWRYAE